MAHLLDQHPEIAFSIEKEPYYFGSDLGGQPLMSESEYLRYFQGSEDQIWAEATVWYLISENAAKEIRQFNPESRVIIMLRNPVEAAYSLHNQLCWSFWETECDFERALQLQDHRRAGLDVPRYCPDHRFLLYEEVFQYTEKIERYLRTFGDERVHIIIYDDFRRQGLAVLRGVLQFVGCNPNFVPEFRQVNTSKVWRSYWLKKLIVDTRFHAVGRLLVPRPLRLPLVRFIDRHNQRPFQRPPMPEHIRRRLNDVFREDICRLSKLLGRDLSFWHDQTELAPLNL